MKIVISSTGPNLKAAVDPRFGRAAFFLIYETDTKEVLEVIDNTEGQDAAQGAGISAAALLAQKGVETILTGRVGPKAMAVIDKAGIKVVDDGTGLVEEVIQTFLASRKGTTPVKSDQAQAPVAGSGRQGRNKGQGLGDGSCRDKGGGGGRGMGRGTGKQDG